MLTKKFGAALAVAMSCAVSHAQAEIDEIIVTASPVAGDKVAVPVSQLDQARLDANGGSSLGDMLAGELGITQSGFATGASRPIIRGLDNFRVRVQENGVSAQGVSALSEDHGAPLDPLSADRIEVLRGPAVLRYGSQAIGGVVTILNGRIPSRLSDEGLTGRAYGALSSVDNGREAALSVDGNLEGVAIHADGFIRRVNDYKLPESSGDQIGTFADTEGFSIGASHIGEAGYLGISGGRYTSKYGIPASGGVTIDMEQDRATIAGEWNGVSFEGGWSDYKHDEIDNAGAVGSTFKNEEWEGRAEYLFTLDNGSDTAVGAQASGRDLSASGEGGELLAPVDSHAVALFGFNETVLDDRFSVQTGLRLEHVSHEGFGVTPDRLDQANAGVPQNIDAFGRNQDRDFTLVSGSAALVFSPDQERLFSLAVNYAERAPAAPELYSKGPHEATETFEVGNPNLTEERALSFEAGVHLDREERHVLVNLFYTQFDGFIHKAFTGFTCDDDFDTCGAGTELTQIQFSQEDAVFYGLEASVTQWVGMVHGAQIGVEGQFDMVRARFDRGGNVPRITPMRLGGGLVAEAEQWSAGLTLTHNFEQDDVAVNETPTKSYNDLSARVSYRPASHNDLTIGLVGQNLTDDVGRNHVSFKKAGVVQPGRNVRLYVRAGF